VKPDNANVSGECQATAETVDMVSHVRTQVDVVEYDDTDVGKIKTNERSACRHQQACNATITVELMHYTATPVTLHIHTVSRLYLTTALGLLQRFCLKERKLPIGSIFNCQRRFMICGFSWKNMRWCTPRV